MTALKQNNKFMRDLSGNILQEDYVYGDGKYTFGYINYLIKEGFIPVATADEMYNLRTSTEQQMGANTHWQANYTTGLDKKYVVIFSLDLGSYTNWTIPSSSFTGIFDGNDVSFTNLGSNNALTTSLLGDCTNAIIKNVNIDINILGTSGTKSGIASSISTTTIDNCHVTGIINTTTTDQVGGLVILATLNSTITNSSSVLTITSGGRTGGFTTTINGSTIHNCFSNCNITSSADSDTGGFLDEAFNSTVYNCYSLGSISATGGTVLSYTGGFVGILTSSSVIYECYSKCSVYHEGIFYVGGFTGRNNSGTITNCYSDCSVETTGSYSGGFYGRNDSGTDSIVNCYHSGSVIVASTPRGGFGGFGNGTLNCYWDTVTSGQVTSAGGTGKTTTEMQQGSIPDTTIYVDWSSLVWDGNSTSEYPTLKFILTTSIFVPNRIAQLGIEELLRIDTDLQAKNRIFKDGNNKVRQVTDKASNIPFVSESGKEPIFSYDGYFDFQNLGDYCKSVGAGSTLDITKYTNASIEIWFYPTIVNDGVRRNIIGNWYTNGYEAYNKILLYFNGTNSLLFLLTTTDFNYTIGLSGSATSLLNTWNQVIIVKEGQNVYGYMNGVYISSVTPNFSAVENNTEMYIGAGQRVNLADRTFSGGRISQFNFYDGIFHKYNGYTNQEQAFTPIFKPFTYFKRYPDDGNKKLHLTSRYLKDAVIDQTDQITSIYDEFGSQLTATGIKPKITNKGFITQSASNQPLTTNILNRGSGDYYTSFWVYFPSGTSGLNYVYQVFSSNVSIGRLSSGYLYAYSSSEGGYITSTDILAKSDKWQHVTLQRTGNSYYFFVDGKLIATKVVTAFDYSAVSIIGIFGTINTANIIVEDVLYSDESIISQADIDRGWFEVPRRGSLEVKPPFIKQPILDLRSTNVNKNASNEVQTWYNYPNPSINSARQTVTANKPIENGDGLEFNPDTSNKHIFINDRDGLLNRGSEPFTLEYYAKVEASKGNKIHFDFRKTKNCTIIAFDFLTIKVWLASSDVSGFDIAAGKVITDLSLSLNTWTHIALVYDGTTLYTYINGVQQAITTAASSIYNEPGLVKIGTGRDSTSSLDGNLDDIKYHPYVKYSANFNDNLPPRSSE